MQRVVVLGASGSVGVQALQICDMFPSQFKVVGLAATGERASFFALAQKYPQTFIATQIGTPLHNRHYVGNEAIKRLLQEAEADIVVCAMNGVVGWDAFVLALATSKKTLVANKEALLLSGPLLANWVKQSKCQIVPVDSEHAALAQCLGITSYAQIPYVFETSKVRKVWLTASGGPHYGKTTQELENVTVAQTLAHPVWSMGKKISVDSATLANKGQEIIEASYLFGLSSSEICVVVNRQGGLHAAVEHMDGNVIAHIGHSSMLYALAFAFGAPHTLDLNLPSIDKPLLPIIALEELQGPLAQTINLARQALSLGHNAVLAYCCWNQWLVDLYLQEKISFMQILQGLSKAFEMLPKENPTNQLEVLAVIELLRLRFVQSCG